MAVSFDASSSSWSNNTTTLTWPHICTGSNGLLLVSTFTNTDDGVTGVTYNGVAMTLVNNLTLGIAHLRLYRLFAPTIGTHNIVVSRGSSGLVYATGVSFASVNQSALDATGTGSCNAATSLTATLNTIANNCWVYMTALLNVDKLSPTSAGTNTTFRDSGENWVAAYDSNGARAAGSNSLQAVWSGSQNGVAIIVSFAPFVASTTTTSTSTSSSTTSTSSSSTSSSSSSSSTSSTTTFTHTLTSSSTTSSSSSTTTSSSSSSSSTSTVTSTITPPPVAFPTPRWFE